MCPGKLASQVFRAGLVGRDKGQVDFRLHQGGQVPLALLGRLAKPLQGHAVLRQIDALLFAKLIDQPVDQNAIDVVPTEVCVAVRCLDLDDSLVNLEDGNVERAPAKVVDRDGLVRFLVEAVG